MEYVKIRLIETKNFIKTTAKFSGGNISVENDSIGEEPQVM